MEFENEETAIDHMFIALYRWKLKSGEEEQFREAWSKVPIAIRKKSGSLGSRLHRSEDVTWVAYAQWPNKEMREADHPLDVAAVAARRSGRTTMKEFIPPLARRRDERQRGLFTVGAGDPEAAAGGRQARAGPVGGAARGHGVGGFIAGEADEIAGRALQDDENAVFGDVEVSRQEYLVEVERLEEHACHGAGEQELAQVALRVEGPHMR